MSRINIEVPRWDQSTFFGRVMHYSSLTDSQNLFCTPKQLDDAKLIVDKYRRGEEVNIPIEDIWKAKYLYDSTFHPDTGEKMMLIGRFSGLLPINTIISGGLLTFYKSTPAVIFWQCLNQSYTAVLNYAHRPANSPLTDNQLGQSSIVATGGALLGALIVKHESAKKAVSPLMGRLGPFVGVFMGTYFNITRIRIRDLQYGMTLFDEDGKEVGRSSAATQEAFLSAWMSKVSLVLAGLALPPVIIHKLEKEGFFRRLPWLATPLQLAICVMCITFATPASFALFPPKRFYDVSDLEPEVQMMINKLPNAPDVVYYNRRLEAQAT